MHWSSPDGPPTLVYRRQRKQFKHLCNAPLSRVDGCAGNHANAGQRQACTVHIVTAKNGLAIGLLLRPLMCWPLSQFRRPKSCSLLLHVLDDIIKEACTVQIVTA